MPFIRKPRWAPSSENCESFLSKIFTPSTTIYKNVHLFGANLLSESSKAVHITSLCDPSIIHYSASRQSCQNLVRVIKTSSTRKPAATDTHSQPYFQDWWWKPWKMFKYFHLTIFWCAHLSLFFTDLTNIHCITLWWATMMSRVHVREGEICQNICCGEPTTADLTRHWWWWPTLRREELENQGWVLGSRRHQSFSWWNRSGTKPDQELPRFEITWSLFANWRLNLFDLRIKIFNQIVKFSDFPPICCK